MCSLMVEEAELTAINPSLKLEVFGSVAYGCVLTCSDIDVNVNI